MLFDEKDIVLPLDLLEGPADRTYYFIYPENAFIQYDLINNADHQAVLLRWGQKMGSIVLVDIN